MHACVRAYERMREEQHLRARQLLGIGPVRTFLRVVLFHAATVVQYMQTPQTPHGFAHIAAGVSTVHTALSCVWSDPINEFNNKTRQQRESDQRPAYLSDGQGPFQGLRGMLVAEPDHVLQRARRGKERGVVVSAAPCE